MGMYDSVYVNCPGCGEGLEFQSKSGKCECKDYNVNNVPIEVVSGMMNDTEYCETCEKDVGVVSKAIIKLVPYFEE